jgi:hypothetical protein
MTVGSFSSRGPAVNFGRAGKRISAARAGQRWPYYLLRGAAHVEAQGESRLLLDGEALLAEEASPIAVAAEPRGATAVLIALGTPLARAM